MNLNLILTETTTMSLSPYELLKISVKICTVDGDGKETLRGTGTIVSNGAGDYYVLTAAHCFRDKQNNDNCGLENVVVIMYDEEEQETRIKPIDWWKSSVSNDAAWLKIDKPNNGFDFVNGLKVLGEEVAVPACVFGYTEALPQGRMFDYAMRRPHLWSCKDNITANGGELFDTISGTSGGGLFIKEGEVICCMGYVKKTFDDDQKLDDVEMYPMTKFISNLNLGKNYVHRLTDLTGQRIRTRECNEDKARYSEAWNRLYNELYDDKDITATLIEIQEAKKKYPNPKNVRLQQQVIDLLYRKEKWSESYQQAFLMALQDKGQWMTLYGEMPKKMGNLIDKELAQKQLIRGMTLLGAPLYEGDMDAMTGDEAVYENILRAAFSLDFSAMRKMVVEWKPEGFWIVRRALLMNLFSKDNESLEQVKAYYRDTDFESLDTKFLTATTINLINGDFTSRIDYQEFWEKGIDGIADLLIYISGNIDSPKDKVGIYGIHNSLLFGGEDTVSFPESLRLLQTIANTGMLPCMNFISVLSNENWMKAVRHLFRDMPYPVVFYTLCYSDEKLLRRVAQELCYANEDKVRLALPNMMTRMLDVFGKTDCPRYFWMGILQMTREWYQVVPEEVWYASFVKNVLHYFCYDIPTENVSYRDVLFQNIEEAISHIKTLERRQEVLMMVLDALDKNSYLVNRIVNELAFDDKLLKQKEIENRVKTIIENHTLKDTYRIIYKVVHLCKVSEDFKKAIHKVAQKDVFDFGHDTGTAYAILSYVLDDETDLNKLKEIVLQTNMWNCGVMEHSFTDPNYIHLENFKKNLRWTETEWEKIKENMLVNVNLIGQERPHRDGLLVHFKKQYINLLSNMRYFIKKIREVEGYDVREVSEKVDKLIHEMRGFNNVMEMLSSDEYDTVVEGCWYLRDGFDDEGLEKCRTEVMLLINRVLLQMPVALEYCTALLAGMVKHIPEEMTSAYGTPLLEVLKRYARDFDYEKLFVSKPSMYKWMRMIAKGVSPKYCDVQAVKYWLEDETVNRFDFRE